MIDAEIEKFQKGAFDMAKEEQTKKAIQKAQKENMNRINEQKAKERGAMALNKEITKRDKVIYEREMKKIQVQEEMEKVKKGQKDPESGGKNMAYMDRKGKQKKMQEKFE